MQFQIAIITCPDLNQFNINLMNNEFVPVVRKRIIDIMIPVRTSLLCEYILIESLVYFSILNPCFVILFQWSLLFIFQAYILSLRLYFSLISCIFFSLNPRFASLLQSTKIDLLCKYFLILVKLNRTQIYRQAEIESHFTHQQNPVG